MVDVNWSEYLSPGRGKVPKALINIKGDSANRGNTPHPSQDLLS